ncbi:MAG: hypothetical protein HC769_31110 [Cyanobacteria bacterium CRU_2_1]|nr:hypothetical protein [Cyanobacteria bacterium CRU_2_1]
MGNQRWQWFHNYPSFITHHPSPITHHLSPITYHLSSIPITPELSYSVELA